MLIAPYDYAGLTPRVSSRERMRARGLLDCEATRLSRIGFSSAE